MAGDTMLETGGADTPSGGSRLTRSLAALILLMLLIAAALWLLLPRSSTIPDVVGSTSDDARVTIANAGFRVGVVSQKQSDKAAAGIVIAQSPVGGTAANPGATVDFTVAETPTGVAPSTTGGAGATGLVLVPNVLGKSEVDANTSISGSNLMMVSTSEVASAPIGTVVSQSPDAGTSVSVGSVVQVVLSSGLAGTSSASAAGLRVPSVLGLSLSAAQRALSGAGWNWTVQYGPGTAVPGAVVYYQSPGGDTYVPSRRTVTIWISTGSATGGWPYNRPPGNGHPGW